MRLRTPALETTRIRTPTMRVSVTSTPEDVELRRLTLYALSDERYIDGAAEPDELCARGV